MAVTATQVQVHDQNALDAAITGYIAQGFVVRNSGEDFAVMFKKREFNILWAVVGLVLCIIPLLIYLIVYATQKDELVELRIVQRPGEVQWSEDRQHWWDGTEWHHVDGGLPPTAQRSPDGEHFWDGTAWRAVPPALKQASLTAEPADKPADPDQEEST